MVGFLDLGLGWKTPERFGFLQLPQPKLTETELRIGLFLLYDIVEEVAERESKRERERDDSCGRNLG